MPRCIHLKFHGFSDTKNPINLHFLNNAVLTLHCEAQLKTLDASETILAAWETCVTMPSQHIQFLFYEFKDQYRWSLAVKSSRYIYSLLSGVLLMMSFWDLRIATPLVAVEKKRQGGWHLSTCWDAEAPSKWSSGKLGTTQDKDSVKKIFNFMKPLIDFWINEYDIYFWLR